MMPAVFRACSVVGIVGFVMGPLGVASAQSETASEPHSFAGTEGTAERNVEAGRLHFQAGAELYERGQFEDALREFERAYELSDRSELFYNYALCYQNLRQPEQAARYLRRYLSEVDEVENRVELERRAVSLETELGALSEPTETRSPPVIVSFAMAGAGLALAATFGGLTLAQRASIEDGCGATSDCTPQQVRRLDRYALVTDVGVGIAAVGTVLGVVFWLSRRGEDSGQPVEHYTQVSPWIGPQSGGTSVSGRF